MPSYHYIKGYLTHWLDKVDQHSIHSPFFFDFFKLLHDAPQDVVEGEAIEKVRRKLLADPTLIPILDLGSGSKHLRGNQRRIADIAQTSLAPPEKARLYYRICQFLEAERIIELGTSFGITTLYLAAIKKSQVFTFEGNRSTADIALTNFEYFDKKNIRLIEGDIRQTLPEFLQNPAKLDFVLMDANHRYEPTILYFDWIMKRLSETSVVIIDDIHQSPEMQKAWRALKNHQLVYGSVDLFHCGILLFDPDLNHQHFTW